MTALNIVAVCIFVFVAIVFMAITIYRLSKGSSQELTLETFIDLYGDVIIEILKSTVELLQIDIENFTTEDDYEMCIISTAIESIKDSSEDFGVDKGIINLFDTVALTEAIHKIFNNNSIDIFSVLSAKSISDNSKLYKEEVVLALGEAK